MSELKIVRCGKCGRRWSAYENRDCVCGYKESDTPQRTGVSQESIDKTNQYFKDKELFDYCARKQEREDNQEW